MGVYSFKIDRFSPIPPKRRRSKLSTSFVSHLYDKYKLITIKIMKKLLFFMVTMLMPMMASADAVEINGIYYNLISKGKIAEVTKSPNYYTGSITIPSSVTYNEDEYDVKYVGKEAFANCTGLTTVTIPNSVIDIGVTAFEECI